VYRVYPDGSWQVTSGFRDAERWRTDIGLSRRALDLLSQIAREAAVVFPKVKFVSVMADELQPYWWNGAPWWMHSDDEDDGLPATRGGGCRPQ
jgi:hypothetical protein